jgi:transposase
MPILAELVRVVIGVDTHKATHTAAVPAAATGGVLATQTVSTTPAGYQALLPLAQQHPGPRVWAVEGTGGYGAGLVRLLAECGEWVVEPDRPQRPTRRHGAKSDPLDAVRAAREALGRDRLAQPRAGGRGAALGMLLAARRSAVDAATCAQQQLQAMVVTAPEPLPARLRGRTTRQLITACARLRVHPSWEVERRPTTVVLWALARRVLEVETEAHLHQQAITSITVAGGPTSWPSSASARSRPPPCWPPGPTRAAAAARQPLPCWAGPRRSRHPRARQSATG